MARLIFISGGTRSGKSDYAMELAARTDVNLVYVATATAGDPEMADRIRRHQEERGERWSTVEEQLDLDRAFEGIPSGSTVVIDCLTLWLTNVMTLHGMNVIEQLETDAVMRTANIIDAVKGFDGVVITVTNELGMGLVPPDRTARLFRDVMGRINRMFADAADEAYMVISGQPLRLTGG